MSTTPKTDKTESTPSSNTSAKQADARSAAFTSFDPIAYWTATQETFAELMSEAFGRATAFAEQYATIEAQLLARAQGAVASWAQLTQDAIAYGAQLSAEARKLGFEAARKASTGA